MSQGNDRQKLIDELVAEGWTWSEDEKHVLVSPDDPNHHAYVDPYSKEVLFSPAWIEAVKRKLHGPSE